jgi:hypothetical protein
MSTEDEKYFYDRMIKKHKQERRKAIKEIVYIVIGLSTAIFLTIFLSSCAPTKPTNIKKVEVDSSKMRYTPKLGWSKTLTKDF